VTSRMASFGVRILANMLPRTSGTFSLEQPPNRQREG
jgi:hypothetical protein